MDTQNLIRMVNRIGDFFESYPDRAEALGEIANHLKKFWDPRMRVQLLQHVDRTQGDGLQDIVRESLRLHARTLQPETDAQRK